jgi:branched-chain amino acid aminotransferase
MSMADRDGFIWYDGKLVPWRDATTHVLTHSLHYGLAVFEGVRAYKTVNGTAIFRLKEHTERLFNSAHIYRMPMPWDKETLMEAQKEVVRANQLESCYLRPIAFYGSEKMGVSPRGAKTHVAIAAWPWGAYLGEEGMEKGIRVKTSSYARHHVNVSMCRAKYSGTYAIWKRPRTATTRPCCSTWMASSPKARARTCSSSRTVRSMNRRSLRR